mmetsp:Transcript_19869/g.50533  ORF Transcript_19869/g.50533 Transcript_19869/m.50533 type:complete len:219 (-) Transcript_19869:1656-2312(-)
MDVSHRAGRRQRVSLEAYVPQLRVAPEGGVHLLAGTNRPRLLANVRAAMARDEVLLGVRVEIGTNGTHRVEKLAFEARGAAHAGAQLLSLGYPRPAVRPVAIEAGGEQVKVRAARIGRDFEDRAKVRFHVQFPFKIVGAAAVLWVTFRAIRAQLVEAVHVHAKTPSGVRTSGCAARAGPRAVCPRRREVCRRRRQQRWQCGRNPRAAAGGAGSDEFIE